MLFCAFVCTAWAGPTDLPEVSTDGNIKWYTIKNVRQQKFATYAGDAATMTQNASTSAASLFYFTASTTNGAVKIHNYAAGDKLCAKYNSWTENGIDWYLKAQKTGVSICTSTGEWDAWNDAGGGGQKVEYWSASDVGSAWEIALVTDFSSIIDVPAAKDAAKTKLNDLKKLFSADATTIDGAIAAIDAINAVDNGLSALNAAVVAVETKLNETFDAVYEGKNIRLTTTGRNAAGHDLTVKSNGVFGTTNSGDAGIWTMKGNGDGTFSLYNFASNLYLGPTVGQSAHVPGKETLAEAGHYTFNLYEGDVNKLNIICNGNNLHLAGGLTVVQWWDNAGGASQWKMELCKDIVVSREIYDNASAAFVSLPYAIQQAYGLVTNANNYYSNWKSEAEGSYEALLDNTTGTYFHSAYTDAAKAETAETHYIQATLAEGVDEFYFYMLPRSGNGNNRPKDITVSGSNDGTEFTKICDVTTTLDASMNPYVSDKLGTAGTTYKYIRLTVNSTNTNTKFFTLSELYFFPANQDVINLVYAYNSFASSSITSTDMSTAAEALINAETVLALSNIKKEVAALLTANATNHAETPALGQYSTAAYNALQAAYDATDATQESLEAAIAAFKKSKNLPVFTIDGVVDYAAGKSIYDDPGNVNAKGNTHYFKATNVYDKTMWWALDMTATEVGVIDEVGIYNVGTGSGFWGTSSIKITETDPADAGDGIFLFYTTGNATPIHYQSDGQLITRWDSKGAASGSAHKFTYIGNTYDLAQLTGEKVTALAKLDALYNANKDAYVGEGLGYYTCNDDEYYDAFDKQLVVAKDILEQSLAGQATTSLSTITDLVTFLSQASTKLSINLPVAGKYYRFQGACEASLPGYYITGHTNWDGGRIALTAEADASTIYYFDGTNLIAYQSGLVIGLNDTHWTFASVDDNSKPASKITFTGSPVKGGAYSIKSADRYFHYTVYNNTVQVNRCADDECAEHAWYITEVTELPVTITDAGYASFYAPVEVTLPTGVTAHTVTENGEWATLSEAISVVPAKNGVILAGEVPAGETRTYNLKVSNIGAKNLTNALSGTVAKTLITKETGAYYVLGVVDGEVGLYNPVKGEDDAKFYNAGHKAYWYIPAATQVAGFRFGGNTTAIESVLNGVDANAPIYDLSGRRVVNAVKGGIYIQNGKKFIVK